jgi:hypothetical protein
MMGHDVQSFATAPGLASSACVHSQINHAATDEQRVPAWLTAMGLGLLSNAAAWFFRPYGR